MDIPLKRCMLFLPINDNTTVHIADLLDYIFDKFKGFTYSRFHFPPIIIDEEEIEGYLIGLFQGFPKEEVICIIIDVNIIENPDVYEITRTVVDKIKSMGEEKIWLTYHDIMLCN